MQSQPKKRIQIVSLKMVKEASILYAARVIRSPADVVGIFNDFLGCPDREHFVVIALDVKMQPNLIQSVSIGSLNASICHPREIFKLAIMSSAASIIVAHNHPSSANPVEPSKDDIDVTRRLTECGNLLSIDILDHVIIGDDGRYCSLKEKGLM